MAAEEGVSFHPGALASAAAAAEGVNVVALGHWVHQGVGSVHRCSVASSKEVPRLRYWMAEVADPRRKAVEVVFHLEEVVYHVWVALSIRPLALK